MPHQEILAEGVELWLGDCREILPTLGKVDAVVTDPPYGIGENNRRNLSRQRGGHAIDYGDFDWDQKPVFVLACMGQAEQRRLRRLRVGVDELTKGYPAHSMALEWDDPR